MPPSMMPVGAGGGVLVVAYHYLCYLLAPVLGHDGGGLGSGLLVESCEPPRSDELLEVVIDDGAHFALGGGVLVRGGELCPG